MSFFQHLASKHEGFLSYFEKPVLTAFLFGMTSGFPLTLVISITGFWLSKYGVDKKTVGMFALATTPYAWKFLWSPVIDRAKLGMIHRFLGQRRSWLFLVQVPMLFLIVYLSRLSPDSDIEMIALIIAGIGFLSATQDIIIDAYRIEIIEPDQQRQSAAMYGLGYRAGNLIAGYGVLVIANYFGWSLAIFSLIILLLPGALAALWIGEPDHPTSAFLAKEHSAHKSENKFLLWLYESVVLPFKEFMLRPNWWLILLFILLVKAGDAVTAIMTAPLIVDLGYNEIDIANANKLVGTIALWIGIIMGSWLYVWAGVFRSLFITGVLMMLTNLVFAWLATMQGDVTALAITVGAENFASGLGGTVIIAYLSSLCNLSFTATQYALLSSLSNQARALFGFPSGYIANELGWIEFFMFSTLLAVPGLLVLLVLWRKNIRANTAV